MRARSAFPARRTWESTRRCSLERAAQGPLAGALGEALSLIPKPLPAGAKFSVTGGAQQFVLTLIGWQARDARGVLSLSQQALRRASAIVNAAEQKIEPQRDGVRLTCKRSPDLAGLPATLHGVFKLSDTVAYDVTAPVVPGEVASPARRRMAAASTTAIGAIGLAFLGGILLNLMPCVFPVLFLKGLALVQSSSQSRAHLLRHGLVYALGILLSFWGIVAVLLVLRATGGHAGWGFQLQSPVFIALLASLIFLLALSLAGQFEIGLSLTPPAARWSIELAREAGLRGQLLHRRAGDRGGDSMHRSADGRGDWLCADAVGAVTSSPSSPRLRWDWPLRICC